MTFAKVPIRDFFKEKCALDSNKKIVATEFYEVYRQWSASKNSIPVRRKEFYERIEMAGIKKKQGKDNKMYYHGIGLGEG